MSATNRTTETSLVPAEPVDLEQLRKQQELEVQMAQLEFDAEQVEEKDTSIDKGLRMLTPDEVEEQKKTAQRANRTRAQKRRDLQKAIRDKQSDRRAMTEDQKPKDAHGKKIPHAMRLTKQKMAQMQSGQLGMSSRGPTNPDDITPEQLEQASKTLENNPHLK